MELTVEASQEVALANLYLLLARGFSSPLEMQPDHPAKLCTTVAELSPALQELVPILAETWEDALKDPDALVLAYARLFLGPFEILAPPYASFYLEPDQRLMGEVSQAVAQTYAACGLVPGAGPREAPDHVAVEWEFMYFLTYRYIKTGDESWLEQRQEFYSTHLQHWVPGLVKAILQADAHPFYNALAKVLVVVIGNAEPLR